MPLDIRGLCPLLQVFDMPTSVRFYRDILGFELVAHAPLRAPDDPPGWCLLRHGDTTEIMLNTAYDYGERPESPDPPASPPTETPASTSAAPTLTPPTAFSATRAST